MPSGFVAVGSFLELRVAHRLAWSPRITQVPPLLAALSERQRCDGKTRNSRGYRSGATDSRGRPRPDTRRLTRLLRRKAGPESLPGSFHVPGIVSLFPLGKSMARDSEPGNLGFPAFARQVRRLSGPFVGAARQDISAATDAGANSNDDDDFARWAAFRTADKQWRMAGRKSER